MSVVSRLEVSVIEFFLEEVHLQFGEAQLRARFVKFRFGSVGATSFLRGQRRIVTNPACKPLAVCLIEAAAKARN
jgi:hypothetical protein